MGLSKEQEKEEFLKICDELKQEILEDLSKVHEMPAEAIEWVENVVDYNCKDGKLNRGISVIHCSEALAKSKNKEFTAEDRKKASTLGWCIEWLQAFFLVADDIMDESITRRGKPCWYLNPKVKMTAINDSFLLESFVFQVLKKHFKTESYYLELNELFREVIYRTELGQLLDLTSQPLDQPVDLNRFTQERYTKIVLFKTAYYTFYLSIACAMHLNNVEDESCFKKAEAICLAIGEYFQVQDDYLDCFGDPKVIGKVGTDIQDNKCSWLVVQTLNKATPAQKELLVKHYGKSEMESVLKIKDLYKTLELEDQYKQYEAESYKKINGMIASVEQMPHDVFHALVEKIYKRSK